jgi:protein CMS1
MASTDGLQEPLIEPVNATPKPELSSKDLSKKRKRIVDLEQPPKKSAKKTKHKKIHSAEDDSLDIAAGINHAFSQMNNQLLADYIAQRTRKYESDLSSVELEDRYLPGP